MKRFFDNLLIDLIAAGLVVGRASMRVGAWAVGLVGGLGVGALATCGTAGLLQAESASKVTSIMKFGQRRGCIGVLMRLHICCCMDAGVQHQSGVRDQMIACTACSIVV